MFIVKLASYLPLSLLYFWFKLAGYFLFYILKYRRTVVNQNIKKCFPSKSSQERFKMEQRYYLHFMEVLAEMTKSYSFKKTDWKTRCKVTNPEILTQHLDTEEPILLLSGHIANWEWPAHAIGQHIGYPMEFIYKRVKNKRFEDIMLKLRNRHGCIPIQKDMALREIVKRKNVSRIIGMIVDQNPTLGAQKVWVDFFGHETPFYLGAEKIAKKMNYPVYFSHCKRIKKGYYEVTFEQVATPPYNEKTAITTGFVKLLEGAIKESPTDYLWSHKRWKYDKSQDPLLQYTSE